MNKLNQISEVKNTPRNYSEIETDFNNNYYCAEGSSGLLFKTADNNDFDGVSNKVLLSATYSTSAAVFEMNKLFNELLAEHMEILKHNNTTSHQVQKETPYNNNELAPLARVLLEATSRTEVTLLEIQKNINTDDFNTEDKFIRDTLFDAGITASRVAMTACSEICDKQQINNEALSKTSGETEYEKFASENVRQ